MVNKINKDRENKVNKAGVIQVVGKDGKVLKSKSGRIPPVKFLS